MKIFSSKQIRQWDAFTIANEPIASIDLMERASAKCAEWIIHNNYGKEHLHFFCSKGQKWIDEYGKICRKLQANMQAVIN